MTHELKTPIAIAYSANDALLNYDSANDPAKKEQYLRIANRQLKRLSELVENILAEHGTKKVHKAASRKDRTAPVRRGNSLGAEDAERKGDSHRDLHSRRTGSRGRPRASVQRASQPSDNAVKYSGDSVRISIKAGSEGISVADDGIGIPAKALPTSSTSSTGCLTATARTCADTASASSMSAAYWRRWDGPSA